MQPTFPHRITSQAPPVQAAIAGPMQAMSPMVKFGIWVTSAYLLVAFARMSEIIASLFNVVIRIPMVLLAFALIAAVFHPSIIDGLRNRIGLMLALLTMWFLCCLPFSVHKGGSVSFLISYWLTTVLICACVMILGHDIGAIRRMLYATATGGLVILSLSLLSRAVPAFQSAMGGMQNPNLFGQQLLYILPFFFLPVYRHGIASIQGLIASSISLVIVSKVLFTGSRASLIATFLLGILVFYRLPMQKKLMMIMASVPALLLMLLMMPELAWQRYATMLQNDTGQAQNMEALSAIESANVRKIHLQQSIDLTFKNPIFGVGPGMFPVASADYSAELGQRAFWKETHNSYTQISSESGVIGLILYVSMLVLTLVTQRQAMRLTRNAPAGSVLAECHIAGFSLFVSTLATLITGNFSSVAYQLYFPLLGAFSVALLHVTRRELAASRKARTPVADPQPTPKRPVYA